MSQDSHAQAPDAAPSDEARLGRSGPIFTRTPEWVLASECSPQAYTLYAALLAHVNRQRGDGIVWPGMDTLAAIVGFRRRQSLRPYIAELEAIGAVDVERNPRSMRRGFVYVVHELPPEGYSGPLTVAEFTKLRRKVLDSIPAPRDGAAPIGEGGTASAARGGAGASNQTNATQTNVSTSTTPSGENTSRWGDRSQARSPVKSPKLTLIRPKEWERLTTEQASQKVVALTVRAYERLGFEVVEHARRMVGQAVTKWLEDGRRRDAVWSNIKTEVAKFGQSGTYEDWIVPLPPRLSVVR